MVEGQPEVNVLRRRMYHRSWRVTVGTCVEIELKD